MTPRRRFTRGSPDFKLKFGPGDEDGFKLKFGPVCDPLLGLLAGAAAAVPVTSA